MEPLVRDISDTARWVAMFRAEESERPDAVFHDPYARMLAGERGEQIANAIEFSRTNSWSFVARTYLFDEFIQQHVAAGYDMIVNLACGLDTRPYRLPFPSKLKWVEVDLPGILQYKESVLANETPRCQLRRIELDLSNRKERKKILMRLSKESEKALVVTEGLMIYLTDYDVAELALDLADEETFRRWAFDMVSPGLLVMAQKEMGSILKEGNTLFQFAPAEGEGFFRRYGWKLMESKSCLKAGLQLNRLRNEDLKEFAKVPEPDGPKGAFPWSGVCLFENTFIEDHIEH
jgi:methyltransferase (TIGR00027 family)